MKTVAIIPARRGSIRIPGKNWKEFHGKPIIQYSIEAAQRTKMFDQVIVSTDGDEIARAALDAGAQVVHRRRPDDGTRGTQDVAAEVLLGSFAPGAAVACVIYPTAPMLTERDLWYGYASFITPGVTYSYAADEGCMDIGWFYWGPAFAFGNVPLAGNSVACSISNERAIDINTPDDWAKAEQMYAAWKAK